MSQHPVHIFKPSPQQPPTHPPFLPTNNAAPLRFLHRERRRPSIARALRVVPHDPAAHAGRAPRRRAGPRQSEATQTRRRRRVHRYRNRVLPCLHLL